MVSETGCIPAQGNFRSSCREITSEAVFNITAWGADPEHHLLSIRTKGGWTGLVLGTRKYSYLLANKQVQCYKAP